MTRSRTQARLHGVNRKWCRKSCPSTGAYRMKKEKNCRFGWKLLLQQDDDRFALLHQRTRASERSSWSLGIKTPPILSCIFPREPGTVRVSDKFLTAIPAESSMMEHPRQ